MVEYCDNEDIIVVITSSEVEAKLGLLHHKIGTLENLHPRTLKKRAQETGPSMSVLEQILKKRVINDMEVH